MKDLRAALQRRREQGLYRERRVLEGPQQPSMRLDGRAVIAFCSNDYLGLAHHPKLVAALKQGADSYGVGAGAAHLINGHSRAHHELEEALAAFTGRERALLFSTGYMANLGAVTALIGRGDQVFEDRLNHASLLDAGLISGARFSRFPHCDTQALTRTLEKTPAKGERMILSDGVFSMDGDTAPVRELAQLAKEHDAWLMIDDAHGLGVLGEHGGGLLAREGLGQDDVPLLMGTLGKAFGTAGAFIAGAKDLIETLIQEARSYIYTTAMPPALAVATLAALELVREEDWRRARLHALIQRLREGAGQLGLPLMASETPIQPLLVGETDTALAIGQALFEAGLLVTAIRPPTVPQGTARLRITLSAAHEPDQVDRLLEALAPHADRLGH